MLKTIGTIAVIACFGAYFIFSNHQSNLNDINLKNSLKTSSETVFYEINGFEYTTVTRTNLSEKIRVTGTLKPARTLKIRSEISAIVEDVHFKVGHPVKQGDLLITLKSDKQTQAIKKLKSSMKASAEQYMQSIENMKRTDHLMARGISTATAMDKAKNEFASAKSAHEINQTQLAMLEDELSETTILAPFNAILSGRFVEPSELVSTNTELVSIVDVSSFEVEVQVPSKSIPSIEIGAKVVLYSDTQGSHPINGIVERISPEANEGTRSATVFLRVLNSDLNVLAGSFVAGDIIARGEIDTIAVPAEAITTADNVPFVYAIINDKVVLKEIQISQTWNNGKNISVKSGLNEGDIILSMPISGISAGMDVKIVGSK